jgi:hypothetical protein
MDQVCVCVWESQCARACVSLGELVWWWWRWASDGLRWNDFPRLN